MAGGLWSLRSVEDRENLKSTEFYKLNQSQKEDLTIVVLLNGSLVEKWEKCPYRDMVVVPSKLGEYFIRTVRSVVYQESVSCEFRSAQVFSISYCKISP